VHCLAGVSVDKLQCECQYACPTSVAHYELDAQVVGSDKRRYASADVPNALKRAISHAQSPVSLVSYEHVSVEVVATTPHQTR
jgi:hypothetical protein